MPMVAGGGGWCRAVADRGSWRGHGRGGGGRVIGRRRSSVARHINGHINTPAKRARRRRRGRGRQRGSSRRGAGVAVWFAPTTVAIAIIVALATPKQ